MPETEIDLPTVGGRYARDPQTGALTPIAAETGPTPAEPIPSGADPVEPAPKSKKGA